MNKAGDVHAFKATPIHTAAETEMSVPLSQEVKKRVVLSDTARKQLQRHMRFGQIGRLIGPQ